MTKQVSCEWKARWEELGSHIHVDLFVRVRGQETWQNTGHIVVGSDQFSELCNAWLNVTFVKRES